MTEPTPYPTHPSQADELNDRIDALASADAFDPVIEAFKAGVDRTQLRQNLALTPEQRLQKVFGFAKLANELREAGRRAREQNPFRGLKSHGC